MFGLIFLLSSCLLMGCRGQLGMRGYDLKPALARKCGMPNCPRHPMSTHKLNKKMSQMMAIVQKNKTAIGHGATPYITLLSSVLMWLRTHCGNQQIQKTESGERDVCHGWCVPKLTSRHSHALPPPPRPPPPRPPPYSNKLVSSHPRCDG